MIDQEVLTEEMAHWRHALHADPELGFDEQRTASFVAARLREFGIDIVAEGVGGTGVVATLQRGKGSRSIGLRADMDALRIHEQSECAYRSRNDGVMHACGHDGHMAMLLGAAKMLAKEGGFDGTVRFIFQPAEEWGRGALSMIEDGLLERFPIDEIYGVHNWPGTPIGAFETCVGPVMSAEDIFDITLKGLGGHASRPHVGREVLVAACAIVLNLQTIVSRRISPDEVAVVSATELTTDGVRNVLPGEARISGDCRSFKPEVSAEIEREMRRIVQGVADTYNCSAEVSYRREFVPLINHREATEKALKAASTVFDVVNGNRAPVTPSEDFAQFLKYVPGCFGFIGNGVESLPLHNPGFDFNNQSLLYGARYFAALARGLSSASSEKS